MDRYNIEIIGTEYGSKIYGNKDINGDWVKWEDVKEYDVKIENQFNYIKQLEAVIKSLKLGYEEIERIATIKQAMTNEQPLLICLHQDIDCMICPDKFSCELSQYKDR